MVVTSKTSAGKKLLALSLIITLLVCGAISYVIYKHYRNRNYLQTFNMRQNIEFSADQVFKAGGHTVDLVKRVSPSVVTVVVKVNQDEVSGFFDQSSPQQGVGTGFFVSETGLLITNEHVVCDTQSPDDISIINAQNKSFKVQTIVSDPYQDIAILKVDTEGENISALKFANSNSDILPGMEVIAIGNPLGVNPGSVTRGIISGLGRNVRAQGNCQNKSVEKDYEGVIQTDAAINTGNSGGPLINLNGEVIGVNSATSSEANNISYAVPSSRVVRLLERYQRNNAKLSLPFLGISYQMIDTNVASARNVPEGAFVMQVVQGGPADSAGIRRGDIIKTIGGKSVDFSLQATLNQYYEPGQSVVVNIFRPNTNALFRNEDNLAGTEVSLRLNIGER